MTDPAFEALATKAVRDLEAVFPEAFRNLAVIIEDEPDEETRRDMELDEDETLLGLYEGVPPTEWAEGGPPLLPARIILYREPILDAAEEDDMTPFDVIRETIWHEVAHALGLDEDRARAAEKKGVAS